LAVKTVGGVPLQTVVPPVMFTDGIGFTVMVMVPTGGDPQPPDTNIVQVTTSPLFNVLVV
jgi:hypothetical protein